MTPVHIAARHGHSSVITEFVKQGISLRNLSRKTGMTVTMIKMMMVMLTMMMVMLTMMMVMMKAMRSKESASV